MSAVVQPHSLGAQATHQKHVSTPHLPDRDHLDTVRRDLLRKLHWRQPSVKTRAMPSSRRCAFFSLNQ
ncbi:Uncharacterised protein [Vibrio cholerae]|nr:Uncharacterised protein [Vibrio cholerae]